MNVAVLGTGSIGLATAALLGREHGVTLWSPGGRGIEGLEPGRLKFSGALEGEAPVRTARDLAVAMADAEVIIVAIPAYGQHAVLQKCAAQLRAGQAVFLMPMLSLAGLVLAQLLAARGLRCLIGGFGTTVMTARKTGAESVRVLALRDRLDVAGMPSADTPRALKLAQQLFGDRFNAQSDLLAISLSQTNPIAHVPLALANLTRMELGEAWTQYDHMAGAIARACVALDRERLAVAQAFGLTVRSIEQHFHLSFGAPMMDFSEQCRWVHETRGSPAGPATLDTRYITEDVPYGLVFNARMGRIAGAPTPVTDGCVALAGAAYGRDFSSENALIAAIDPALLNGKSLLAALRSS